MDRRRQTRLRASFQSQDINPHLQALSIKVRKTLKMIMETKRAAISLYLLDASPDWSYSTPPAPPESLEKPESLYELYYKKLIAKDCERVAELELLNKLIAETKKLPKDCERVAKLELVKKRKRELERKLPDQASHGQYTKLQSRLDQIQRRAPCHRLVWNLRGKDTVYYKL